MFKTFYFLKEVIDSLFEHIVVLDEKGKIVFTNKAWDDFAKENDCLIEGSCPGINYLEVCDEAAKNGDEYGRKASAGIREVQNGLPDFYFEYPCHSQDKKRWFMMRAKSLEARGKKLIVISHINITERKIAEEKALNLSQIDCLTGLFNRRHFDELFIEEWKRSSRLVLPITIAMIDIDYFKLLNDNYGHQYADECLVKVGSLVKEYANRPGDICARYGGDEIVTIFGNSTRETMFPRLLEFMEKIKEMNISNKCSPISSYVTVSIGVATWYPSRFLNREQFIKEADTLLYKAKENGRNRIEY